MLKRLARVRALHSLFTLHKGKRETEKASSCWHCSSSSEERRNYCGTNICIRTTEIKSQRMTPRDSDHVCMSCRTSVVRQGYERDISLSRKWLINHQRRWWRTWEGWSSQIDLISQGRFTEFRTTRPKNPSEQPWTSKPRTFQPQNSLYESVHILLLLVLLTK